MICETCHGSGKVMRDALPVCGVMPGDPESFAGFSIWQPCPECTGGIAHCCDGLRACPEDEQERGGNG